VGLRSAIHEQERHYQRAQPRIGNPVFASGHCRNCRVRPEKLSARWFRVPRTHRSAHAKRRCCTRVGILDDGAGRSLHPCFACAACRHSKFADPPHPDDATELLAALPMQAIVFAFTTASYIQGPDGEQALKVRLEKRANGIPAHLVCDVGCATNCAVSTSPARRRSPWRAREPTPLRSWVCHRSYLPSTCSICCTEKWRPPIASARAPARLPSDARRDEPQDHSP
jgi:hypothetical protein